MPPQKKPGGLMAKYGAKLAKHVKEHANDPIRFGSQDPPPGITNGIARLIEAGFAQVAEGKQNAGEYYFRAAGTIVEPKTVEHNGSAVNVEGLRTTIIMPMYATGKLSQEENFDRVRNMLGMLGGEGFMDGAELDSWEERAATLQEAAPFFRFSTKYKPAAPKPGGGEYPEGVYQNWYGNKGLENYSPNPDDGTVDDTGGGDAGGREEAGGDDGSGNDSDGDTDYTAMSLEDLAAAATDNDTAAQEEISRRGEEAGVGQETNDAQSWEDAIKVIADATKPKAGKGGKGGGKAAAGVTPKVGETYSYAPVDPKTKKAGKPIEVTVKDVVAKMRICTVVDVANPKRSWGQVSFDDLHQPF